MISAKKIKRVKKNKSKDSRLSFCQRRYQPLRSGAACTELKKDSSKRTWGPSHVSGKMFYTSHWPYSSHPPHWLMGLLLANSNQNASNQQLMQASILLQSNYRPETDMLPWHTCKLRVGDAAPPLACNVARLKLNGSHAADDEKWQPVTVCRQHNVDSNSLFGPY